MNPLFSAMNTSPMNNIGSTIQFLKGKNPMFLLNNLAQQNPQARQVLNMIQQGSNPQQLFYQMCQSRGINPNDILNQLK